MGMMVAGLWSRSGGIFLVGGYLLPRPMLTHPIIKKYIIKRRKCGHAFFHVITSLKLRTYRYNKGPCKSEKGARKIKVCQGKRNCPNGSSMGIEIHII